MEAFSLKDKIKRSLSAIRKEREPSDDDLVDAAVLLLLTRRESEIHIILTRRSNNVATHKGEISLPGGICEPDDLNPLDTALRETEEEIGVAKNLLEVLGELSPVSTTTSYLIYPFVAWAEGPLNYRICPDETEEIIEMPLRHILTPGVFEEEYWTVKGRKRKIYSIIYNGNVIWGATARILKQFVDVCFGEDCGNDRHSRKEE
ncbi:MAG: CoA pyrophosphatase [Candidatus Aenigmatarchaeota archaeon]